MVLKSVFGMYFVLFKVLFLVLTRNNDITKIKLFQVRRNLQDCQVLAWKRKVWIYSLALLSSTGRLHLSGLDRRREKTNPTAWIRSSDCKYFNFLLFERLFFIILKRFCLF
jgi:hypothetical protein